MNSQIFHSIFIAFHRSMLYSAMIDKPKLSSGQQKGKPGQPMGESLFRNKVIKMMMLGDP